jgi:hypothetical protein
VLFASIFLILRFGSLSIMEQIAKRASCHTKQEVVEDNSRTPQESQVVGSVGLDQRPETSKPLGRSNLCEFCRALDFDDLFYLDSRYMHICGGDAYPCQINTLENVAKQNGCPLCRLLLRVVSASSFTVRDPNRFCYEPGRVYVETLPIDFALLGISQVGKRVARCLHIQSGRSGLNMFDQKIVLLADANGKKSVSSIQFCETS